MLWLVWGKLRTQLVELALRHAGILKDGPSQLYIGQILGRQYPDEDLDCTDSAGLQPPDTIPESKKAAEHQQRPRDPAHKREPDSHDFHFEIVDKPREQDKPG